MVLMGSLVNCPKCMLFCYCVNVQLFELLHTVAIASWQISLKDEAHFAPSLL